MGTVKERSKLAARADAPSRDPPGGSGTIASVAINRIAWIVTVFVALLTALLLLLSGYTGYAGLGVAVAVAAAINLL